MNLGAKTLRATMVQTLIFYDEPQLILLKSEKDNFVFAVAINRPGMEHPYFACEARAKNFEKYMNGKADLHFVFKEAIREKYYFLELGNTHGETFTLTPAADSEATNLDYWPLPGSFSRSHTDRYKTQRSHQDPFIKIFKIDGNWSAGDFAHFHAKISNLYALFTVLHRIDTGKGKSEKAYVRQSIQERFWRGGGSYVGFYDDLFDHVQSDSPLEVARIQYASPGEIALRGDKGVFSGIDQIIDLFGLRYKDFQTAYKNLHGILAVHKLLRARRDARFPDSKIAQLVREQSIAFAQAMKIDKVDELYEASDKNTLVFCKLVLSIYRRAHELYSFRAEGRVQSDE